MFWGPVKRKTLNLFSTNQPGHAGCTTGGLETIIYIKKEMNSP